VCVCGVCRGVCQVRACSVEQLGVPLDCGQWCGNGKPLNPGSSLASSGGCDARIPSDQERTRTILSEILHAWNDEGTVPTPRLRTNLMAQLCSAGGPSQRG